MISSPTHGHHGVYRPSDPLQIYMREMAQTPLLTVAEEAILAHRIKKGDESAREHMIKANLRLVVKIAHEYENRGLPLLDLINEGNIGLMLAVDRFDPSKGKFSTYGVLWIKQSIRRGIAYQSKTIRLPANILTRLSDLYKTESLLWNILGRQPTEYEIADELNIRATRVEHLRSLGVTTVSLDSPVGQDTAITLKDMVPDDKIILPSVHIEAQNTAASLEKLLSTLPRREQFMIRARFGFNGGEPKTFQEMSTQYKMTREGVRQVITRSLIKLRHIIDGTAQTRHKKHNRRSRPSSKAILSI